MLLWWFRNTISGGGAAAIHLTMFIWVAAASIFAHRDFPRSAVVPRNATGFLHLCRFVVHHSIRHSLSLGRSAAIAIWSCKRHKTKLSNFGRKWMAKKAKLADISTKTAFLPIFNQCNAENCCRNQFLLRFSVDRNFVVVRKESRRTVQCCFLHGKSDRDSLF